MRLMGWLLLALAVGCSAVPVTSHDGDQDAGATSGGLDGGSTDGGVDPGGGTDGGLWPNDARLLEASVGVGGFSRGCPFDGGMVFGASYVVPFDGAPMTYTQCLQGTLEVRSGSKALGADGLAALEATLRHLSVDEGCAFNQEKLSLTITTSATVLRYVDSLCACQKEPGVVYVANMAPVFAKLAELAQ